MCRSFCSIFVRFCLCDDICKIKPGRPRLSPVSSPLPLRAQRALGARNLALLAGHLARRQPHSHGQRLERALCPVVVVEAAQTVDVQRDACALRKALQAVRDHLAAEVANLFALEAELDDAVGPIGDVDDGARQGLVEGRIGRAEAGDAGGAAEGLVEGVAERNADVLGSMVVVDYTRQSVGGTK